MILRIVLSVVLFACAIPLEAQTTSWPSPEVEQMYRQSKEYLSRGAIDEAVVILRQAIRLAPEVTLLYRDLGQTLSLGKKYKEAWETVEPLIEKGVADEETYQVAGNALMYTGERKKAKAILEQGIGRYPHSGLLYHEFGWYYEAGGATAEALKTWTEGITNDPGYHMNYYEAARTYAVAGNPVWTILYGEIFVNLERYTARSEETRKHLMAAYRTLFNNIGSDPGPAGKSRNSISGSGFETAVMDVMTRISPVVSDGINTENLIMLRTRFIMDWMPRFGDRYSFSLFSYQDKMLRDGWFDIYNQWLFGKADNEKQYESWAAYNVKAVAAFGSWFRDNRLQPSAADFLYNAPSLSPSKGGKKAKR